MFDGFKLERIDVGEAVLRVRHGGSGPAVLLVHDHPRTHATWHMVASLLAERFTLPRHDVRGGPAFGLGEFRWIDRIPRRGRLHQFKQGSRPGQAAEFLPVPA